VETHSRAAPLPLIDDIEIKSVLATLEQRGIASHELLKKAHVPTARSDASPRFLSARSVLRVLSLGAREAEWDSLSWRSAVDTSIAEIGSWGQNVSRCRTLRETIQSFCHSYRRSINFLDLGLTTGRESAWFWRRRHLPSVDPAGEEQGEQFTLGAMVKVVRHFAGADWFPTEVRMDSDCADWLEPVLDVEKTRLSFGYAAMAIAVPFEFLDVPVRRPSIAGLGPGTGRTEPDDFIGSLLLALEPIVSMTPLSIELGAEIAGTSPRTLRRWLQREGTTWRRVVDRVRLEKSIDLLQNSMRPVAEIAYEVGYSHPAHFSRAFQRWTQESPTDYRRRRQCGEC
jgi:AraC-like DNA-binding protein